MLPSTYVQSAAATFCFKLFIVTFYKAMFLLYTGLIVDYNRSSVGSSKRPSASLLIINQNYVLSYPNF